MEEINTGSNRITISFDNNLSKATCKYSQFPFKSVLSLDPLLELWEGSGNTKKIKVEFAKPVIEKIKNIPELRGPITDLSILKKAVRKHLGEETD